MKDKPLWKYGKERTVANTRVFDVVARDAESCEGVTGEYYSVGAPDWATVVVPYDGKFVTVRQWRHGACAYTVEFPGGIIEKGEEPALAAARELEEETGYKAKNLVKLAELNPNPALFTNTLYVFLAEGVGEAGERNLDEDEYIDVSLIPQSEVWKNFGQGEYINAFMGTALALYRRYLKDTNNE